MSISDTKVAQGESFCPIVTVTKDSEIDLDTTSPTFNPCGAVDVTGNRFRSAIKAKPDPALAALAALDSDNAGEFTILPQTPLPFQEGDTRGQVQPNYTAAQTAAIARGRYYVDVWMFDGTKWTQVVPTFAIFIEHGIVEPLEP